LALRGLEPAAVVLNSLKSVIDQGFSVSTNIFYFLPWSFYLSGIIYTHFLYSLPNLLQELMLFSLFSFLRCGVLAPIRTIIIS